MSGFVPSAGEIVVRYQFGGDYSFTIDGVDFPVQVRSIRTELGGNDDGAFPPIVVEIPARVVRINHEESAFTSRPDGAPSAS